MHPRLLGSQCQATRLYEKLGFVSNGEVFQEAGIDHIKMSRALKDLQP